MTLLVLVLVLLLLRGQTSCEPVVSPGQRDTHIHDASRIAQGLLLLVVLALAQRLCLRRCRRTARPGCRGVIIVEVRRHIPRAAAALAS